ncbi:MAG: pilus assembly protein CpaB [Thermoleophilaceae bacterium]|nr:pilus assembly protein CpaB [Thermoleophilaceae bacterium]
MTARRRRGVLMLSLALASGGLAASEVSNRTRAVEQRVGPLVRVVTVRTRIAPGTKLTRDKLAVRGVPSRFVPPDALTDPRQAEGLRTGAELPPGSYLTAAAFATGGQAAAAAQQGDRPAGPLRRGERAIELTVGGATDLEATPGARVDVVVTGEKHTALALEDVELLALRPGAGNADATGGKPTATATLRVTLREAVYLTAAQNFAREIRLLARAPGDRRRGGALEVPGAAL